MGRIGLDPVLYQLIYYITISWLGLDLALDLDS